MNTSPYIVHAIIIVSLVFVMLAARADFGLIEVVLTTYFGVLALLDAAAKER